MEGSNVDLGDLISKPIPWIGARKFARELQIELEKLLKDRNKLSKEMDRLGILPILMLEGKRKWLQNDIAEMKAKQERILQDFEEQKIKLQSELDEIKKTIIETEDTALLQEMGLYNYRHRLSSAVAYKDLLEKIQQEIKDCAKNGGAVNSAINWTVNGSQAEGKKMIKETTKLMLRAFNAEAESLVWSLKPYKLDASIDKLRKAADTIARLGKTMEIHITDYYLHFRIKELEVTADFLHKQAEEKEIERAERERIRDERKAQAEIERERLKLEKEKSHYENALQALIIKGDEEAIARMRVQLDDINEAVESVNLRAANIRAGYVYVISNIGSFGEDMVKIGMTRRLDPMDRIRELGDASVPFNFDVHALFFSKDAVGIENSMHQFFAEKRVNQVNLRREFFRITPSQAKEHLSKLAGELLQFQDIPDATEYREGLAKAGLNRRNLEAISEEEPQLAF